MHESPDVIARAHDGAAAALNGLSVDRAQETFMRCCAAERWAAAMTHGRPYAGGRDLQDHAERCFDALAREDWLQAFAAHARIGEPRDADAVGSEEQNGAAALPDPVREELAADNRRYEERFGHVFLIRARGRDAAAMLDALRERSDNPPDVELRIAAEQQREITRLRIADLLGA